MALKQELSSDQAKNVVVELQRPVSEKGGGKSIAAAQACTTANDMWACPRGSFIMNGRTGTANYEFGGDTYNTTWTFEDCYEVGQRAGWTYKEDGYAFYMFFSKRSSSNGKFELLWSGDNEDFTHFCWAD